jgi:hypothetical protein
LESCTTTCRGLQNAAQVALQHLPTPVNPYHTACSLHVDNAKHKYLHAAVQPTHMMQALQGSSSPKPAHPLPRVSRHIHVCATISCVYAASCCEKQGAAQEQETFCHIAYASGSNMHRAHTRCCYEAARTAAVHHSTARPLTHHTPKTTGHLHLCKHTNSPFARQQDLFLHKHRLAQTHTLQYSTPPSDNSNWERRTHDSSKG